MNEGVTVVVGMLCDLRAVVLLSIPCLCHCLVGTVPVYQVAWCSIRAKVEVGVGGTHDVWVLLCPGCFACNLHDEVWVLVNLNNGERSADDAEWTCARQRPLIYATTVPH